MSDLTWAEAELLQSISAEISSGDITVTHDTDAILAALDATFPFPDNRLDWSKVPGAIADGGPTTPHAPGDFVGFLSSLSTQLKLSGRVAVIGDNQINFAVLGELANVLRVLARITEFPQHTYIYPYPNVTWCASKTFENDFYFGFAPIQGTGQ